MTNGTVIDTSIWVNYLSQSNFEQVFTTNKIIDSKKLFVLPVIFQEILQGINDDLLFEKIKYNFLAFKSVKYDNYIASLEAAKLYRFLRKKGVTIRKPNDCLIGYLCIELNLSLYHCDKDFDNIAKHTSLKIYK